MVIGRWTMLESWWTLNYPVYLLVVRVCVSCVRLYPGTVEWLSNWTDSVEILSPKPYKKQKGLGYPARGDPTWYISLNIDVTFTNWPRLPDRRYSPLWTIISLRANMRKTTLWLPLHLLHFTDVRHVSGTQSVPHFRELAGSRKNWTLFKTIHRTEGT